MGDGSEAGFRIIGVTPRPAIGPFQRNTVKVTLEAVDACSMTITIVRPSGGRLQVLKLRRLRLDFSPGETLTGVARMRDKPTPGAVITPSELRDLGWCRGELNRRSRTAAVIV